MTRGAVGGGGRPSPRVFSVDIFEFHKTFTPGRPKPTALQQAVIKHSDCHRRRRRRCFFVFFFVADKKIIRIKSSTSFRGVRNAKLIVVGAKFSRRNARTALFSVLKNVFIPDTHGRTDGRVNNSIVRVYYIYRK